MGEIGWVVGDGEIERRSAGNIWLLFQPERCINCCASFFIITFEQVLFV